MSAQRFLLVPVVINLAILLLPVVSQSAAKKAPPPAKYTVTGTITGLAPSHHAQVKTSSNNHPPRTATTQTEGIYTLRNVVPGSYTVRPSRAGYAFSPTFRTVAVTTADRDGIDFVARPLPARKNR